jgi:hypothetical protein
MNPPPDRPGGQNCDMRRRWRLVVAATAVAGVVLGAAAIVAWQHLRPRLASVSTATSTLDGAIATVVTAVGDSAAVAVTGLVPVQGCQQGMLAKGSRYTRTADLYTDPGSESVVIDRVAAALPATDRAQRAGQNLTADLGSGIHLQLIPVGAGWLAATAETDCRATSVPSQAVNVSDQLSQPATQLLERLGAVVAVVHADTVACGAGRITTVDVASRPTATDNLPKRLEGLLPPGARTFQSSANRLAWRDPTDSMIVAASDDGTQITIQRTVSTC